MAAWKAYAWEHARWPEYQTIKLTEAEVHKYLKKFSRHFKLNPPPTVRFNRRTWGIAKTDVRFIKDRRTGRWEACSGVIELMDNPRFGVFIHEFAHILADIRYQRSCNHTRRFKHELKRCYTWAKRYLRHHQSEAAAA